MDSIDDELARAEASREFRETLATRLRALNRLIVPERSPMPPPPKKQPHLVAHHASSNARVSVCTVICRGALMPETAATDFDFESYITDIPDYPEPRRCL